MLTQDVSSGKFSFRDHVEKAGLKCFRGLPKLKKKKRIYKIKATFFSHSSVSRIFV